MPSLSSHSSSYRTKLLLLGDTGSGKSGALASLAAAGYNLRILDLDAGLDVLKNILMDPKSPYPKGSHERVQFTTITDPMRNVGGKLVPSQATTWTRAINMIEHWREAKLGEDGKAMKGADGKTLYEVDLGPLTTWTDKDVLVLDSLTFLSKAALNFVLSANARLGQQAQQQDWYQGQQLVESLLEKLSDDGIKCNIVVISHIVYIGEDNGPQQGYPSSLGKALSPKIGRYFNSVLMAKSSGSGANVRREILTNSTQMVELKNTAPLRVAQKYPLETGLADYFRDVRGEGK